MKTVAKAVWDFLAAWGEIRAAHHLSKLY